MGLLRMLVEICLFHVDIEASFSLPFRLIMLLLLHLDLILVNEWE